MNICHNKVYIFLKIVFGAISGKRAFNGPYRITVDVHNKCDLGCIMCPSHSNLLGNKSHIAQKWYEYSLSFKSFKNLIEDVVSINVRSISICGGGEPFLHPEIISFIKLVKDNGLECSIFTNGVHINKSKVDKLIEIGLDRIILSLHAGDIETYLKIHPESNKDCFIRISDWLEYLKNVKQREHISRPKIKLRAVVTNKNYNRLDLLSDFAANNDVDFLEFKIAYLPFDIFKRELALSENQIKDLIFNLKKINKNISIRNNIASFVSTLQRRINYDKDLKDKGKTCLRKKMFCFKPWASGTILTDGTVLSCIYNAEAIGNINNESFSKLWFSNKYNKFRNNLYCEPCSAAAFSSWLNIIHKIVFFKQHD